MQNTDYYDRIRRRPVIDRIGTVKNDPQPNPKPLTRRCGQGKPPGRRTGILDSADEVVRYCLRSLFGQIGPDVGNIVLRRLGQAQGQRVDNSFLPRSMILPTSNS